MWTKEYCPIWEIDPLSLVDSGDYFFTLMQSITCQRQNNYVLLYLWNTKALEKGRSEGK